MTEQEQLVDEFSAIVKMLEDDAANLKLEDAIKDYIVPILYALANDSNVIKHNLFKVSESSALALLTSQKTLAGELLAEIANNYVLVQPEVESLSQEAQEAFANIGALLSSWLEVSDEEYEEYEEAEEEDEGEEDDDIEEEETPETSVLKSDASEGDDENAAESNDTSGSTEERS